MENEGGGSRRHGTLVLFPGALGDAVCVEPAVRWLARSGLATFYARGASAEVARLFPCRPRVRSLDAPEVARLFAPLEEAGEIRPTTWLDEFATIVSFTGAANGAFRARLESTGRALVLPFPERHGGVHASDEMLAALGAPIGTPAYPSLLAPEGEAPEAAGPARPRLAVHPGSGGAAKRIPEDLLREVGARWRAASGGSITVLLGPAEAGEDELWQRRFDRVIRPASIERLAGVLAEADAYVGCDAGPSHVAAALGVFVTVVFPSTDPERFGPRGTRAVHVDLRSARDDALERVWAAVAAGLP